MPQRAVMGSPWDARRITREEELAYLREQAGALREELDAIAERMGELESESGSGEKE